MPPKARGVTLDVVENWSDAQDFYDITNVVEAEQDNFHGTYRGSPRFIKAVRDLNNDEDDTSPAFEDFLVEFEKSLILGEAGIAPKLLKAFVTLHRQGKEGVRLMKQYRRCCSADAFEVLAHSARARTGYLIFEKQDLDLRLLKDTKEFLSLNSAAQRQIMDSIEKQLLSLFQKLTNRGYYYFDVKPANLTIKFIYSGREKYSFVKGEPTGSPARSSRLVLNPITGVRVCLIDWGSPWCEKIHAMKWSKHFGPTDPATKRLTPKYKRAIIHLILLFMILASFPRHLSLAFVLKSIRRRIAVPFLLEDTEKLFSSLNLITTWAKHYHKQTATELWKELVARVPPKGEWE